MDDDLPAGDGEPIERDAQERPPDPAEERDRVPPAVDMNMNTTADMSQNTDMADVADMGLSDDGTPPTTDMEDPCGPPPCMLGETRCQSDQLSTCMRDTDGCPGWAPPQDCPMGGVCQNDRCPSAETCVDNDGDGRGTSCPMGPDCDNDDATIYDGAPELCDGVDNDCDQLIDDGVPGVGEACTSGVGACAVMGTNVCGAGGQVTCDATAGTPQPEMCDMIDNDCDGQTDEDGVCPLPMCAQDDQEPNNSVTTGFAMSINQPLWGFTCQGDMEFFALPVLTAGSTYRINVAFPHSTSDIDIKLYRNGSVWKSSDSVTDHEQITFTAAAGDTYVVEVDNLDPTASNFYRITLLKTWACGSDDAFESNDTISTASLLPQSWRASAYNCADNNDWYLLGRHASGVTLDVRAYFGTGLFGGGDIDMVLYGDSDGDNTYEPLVQANAGGSDEFLTHTTTFGSLYFVRVFTYDPLDSNDYDIYWTK